MLSITAGAPSASATEVLGEPTNDLDTETLAALEDLLDTWPGTVIVVSHDRYLVERVADTVLALAGDGTVRHRPGGVEQYLADRARADGAGARGSGSGAAGSGVAASAARGDRAGSRGDGAGDRGSGSGVATPGAAVPGVAAPSADGGSQLGSGELRQLRKDLQRLEKQMESLRRKQAGLHEKLAGVGADYQAAAALNAELKDLGGELAAAELEWLETAERLEG